MIKTKREVPFAKVRLESQRFQCFRIRFLLPVLGGFEEMVHHTCGCRESRMGKSELRVKPDRLIVKIYRCLKILEQVIRSPLIIAAAQIQHVRIGIAYEFGLDTSLFMRLK